MKIIQTAVVCAVLLVLAAAPARAQSRHHVTALDVRRACLNPDPAAKAELGEICDLQLPGTRQQMARPDAWKAWSDVFSDSMVDPAVLIQRHSVSLDEERILAAQVLDLIDPGERVAILRRLGRDTENLQNVLRTSLSQNAKAELTRAIFELRGELAVASDSARAAIAVVADSAAATLEVGIEAAAAPGIGGLSVPALAEALDTQLQNLSAPQLLVLVSSRPEIEREVLTRLLGDRTVADLVSEVPGRESIRLATNTQQQLAGTQTAPMRVGSLASNVAWGVSDFVVDRVEHQLRTYAIRGLARHVCAEVGAAMLRESCQVLHSSEFGVSTAGATMLRSAVRRDLERLPTTALAWTYQEFSDRLEPSSRDQFQVVMRGVGFTLNVSRGTDPWLAFSSAVDSLVPARRAALQAEVTRLQGELDRVWSKLRAPETTEAAKRGLREQARALERQISDRAPAVVAQYLDPAAFPLASVLSDLSALYATRFDHLRIRPATWGEDVARTLLHAQLVAMLANVRTQAGGVPDISRFQPWRFAPISVAVDEEFRRIQQLRVELDSMHRQLGTDTVRVHQARLYVVQAAFSALDRLLADVQRADLADVTAAQRALALAQEIVIPLVTGDHGAAVLGLRDQMAVLAPGLVNPGSDIHWMRGLTFVSELGSASSPDQVNTALVRLTDAGQGFEAKRDTRTWRFGLNAYGGIYGGANWGGVTRERAGGESAAFGGLYLPVGLAVTTPYSLSPFKVGRAGTLGAFFQLADLGALASWRLDQGDTVDQRPEVDVGQVFSPGAFLVLNIRTLPISVGYGWSYAPQLRRARELNDEDGEDGETGEPRSPERFSADRRGLFIAIDVPLFP